MECSPQERGQSGDARKYAFVQRPRSGDIVKQQHGGPGRGQGRKPLPDDERTVVVTVRLTPARRDKLRLLGAHWLAKAVDRARDPDAT